MELGEEVGQQAHGNWVKWDDTVHLCCLQEMEVPKSCPGLSQVWKGLFGSQLTSTRFVMCNNDHDQNERWLSLWRCASGQPSRDGSEDSVPFTWGSRCFSGVHRWSLEGNTEANCQVLLVTNRLQPMTGPTALRSSGSPR